MKSDAKVESDAKVKRDAKVKSDAKVKREAEASGSVGSLRGNASLWWQRHRRKTGSPQLAMIVSYDHPLALFVEISSPTAITAEWDS